MNAIIDAQSAVALAQDTVCPVCGVVFEPRTRSGGKALKFCSTESQSSYAQRGQRGANAAQRAPTCSASPTLAAVVQPDDQAPQEALLLAAQGQVTAGRDEHGNLILRQAAWPDDDVEIVIHRDYEMQFVDALCDFLGHCIRALTQLDNVRRGELKRLLRHRGVSEIEVHNAVEDIMTERARWTAAALGRRVDLTFEEQILFGIRTIACVDRTKRMMRLYFRERKRDRDRRRINEMRARIPTNSISLRARELTAVLNDEWTESRALGALMQKRWKLKRDAMEKAVHRASQELCDASIAERKYGSGSRGSRVLFLRLKKPMNVDVSEYRGARNTDEIRLLRRSDSKLSGRHCRADKNESTSPKKFNKTGHKSRGPRALKMESPHRLLVYGDSQKMAPLQSGWPSERGRKDGRAPQRRTRQAASEEGRMPPVGGNRPMRRSTGTEVNMIVTESNIVTDEGGHILAGPFASMRQHWRWMDLNTNKGLAHQDQFNRIGRAFDGQTIEGLGRPRSDPTDATSLTVIVDE